MFNPHLRYCRSLWGSRGESRKLTLRNFKNLAVRIVTNSWYDAFACTLFGILNWNSVNGMKAEKTVTMVYKSIDSLAPNYISHLLAKSSSRDIFNSNTDWYDPFMNNRIGQKALLIITLTHGMIWSLHLNKSAPYSLSEFPSSWTVLFVFIDYFLNANSVLWCSQGPLKSSLPRLTGVPWIENIIMKMKSEPKNHIR